MLGELCLSYQDFLALIDAAAFQVSKYSIQIQPWTYSHWRRLVQDPERRTVSSNLEFAARSRVKVRCRLRTQISNWDSNSIDTVLDTLQYRSKWKSKSRSRSTPESDSTFHERMLISDFLFTFRVFVKVACWLTFCCHLNFKAMHIDAQSLAIGAALGPLALWLLKRVLDEIKAYGNADISKRNLRVRVTLSVNSMWQCMEVSLLCRMHRHAHSTCTLGLSSFGDYLELV